ncbi:MAG: ABC transporter permease, partial [Gemmatimonadota bacterium]
MSRTPPKFAEGLIRLLLPREEHEELLGDLHERFQAVQGRRGPVRASAWYWMQTSRSIPHLFLGRLRAVPRRGRLSTNQGISVAGIRSPFRILRQEPLLSLTTVCVLAIGIGAPTTMYSIVTGLRQGLPLPDAHELVAISRHDPASSGAAGFKPAQFDALRENQSTMVEVAAYRLVGAQVDGWPGAPTRAAAAEISAQAFGLLGVDPVLGRLPSAADVTPGASPVVLIGEDHWRGVYASDPDVIGASVRINGVTRTVIGVLPSWFRFPVDQTVWIPLEAGGLDDAQATSGAFQLFGRLLDGMALDVAQTDIQRAARMLDASPQAVERVVTVRPFQEAFLGRGAVASVLLLIVSFVLVIASANVASLLLGRAMSRRKEIAVRMALGGSRGRIRLQFLSEAAVLAALGVGLGVTFTLLGVEWFDQAVLTPYIDLWWTDVAVDSQALVFAACCGLGATLIAGIAPALSASDVSLVDAMRADRTGAIGGRARGFTGWLVAAQLSLSCTLLILTTVLVQAAVEEGYPAAAYDPATVMTGRLSLGAFDYPDDDATRAFARDLET